MLGRIFFLPFVLRGAAMDEGVDFWAQGGGGCLFAALICRVMFELGVKWGLGCVFCRGRRGDSDWQLLG